MIIAFFDFDGTITHKDSFIDFLIFTKGKFLFLLGIIVLSPIILAYKLKFIPNWKAKELVLSYFFKGISKKEFEEISKNFSLKMIDSIVKKSAIDRIKFHQDNNHKVVVVSASLEDWLKPWCDLNNLDLICTKIEFINDKFTGKLLTKNCYGIEKLNRINEKFNLEDYNLIYAYGDTKGDKEMLNIANYHYYKKFK